MTAFPPPFPLPFLYCIQHSASFTNYFHGQPANGPLGTFIAPGEKRHCVRRWLSRHKITQHLLWDPQALRNLGALTPFISLFADRGDAERGAKILLDRGCNAVFLTESDMRNATLSFTPLDRAPCTKSSDDPEDDIPNVPVTIIAFPIWTREIWDADAEVAAALHMFSSQAVRELLQFNAMQRSEWAVVNEIGGGFVGWREWCELDGEGGLSVKEWA